MFPVRETVQQTLARHCCFGIGLHGSISSRLQGRGSRPEGRSNLTRYRLEPPYRTPHKSWALVSYENRSSLAP